MPAADADKLPENRVFRRGDNRLFRVVLVAVIAVRDKKDIRRIARFTGIFLDDLIDHARVFRVAFKAVFADDLIIHEPEKVLFSQFADAVIFFAEQKNIHRAVVIEFDA